MKTKTKALICLAVVVVGGFYYGNYYAMRYLEYKMWYESQVRATILYLVKPSCLNY